MIGSLRPYPAYKDSGVEWLGEVPKGWEVRRQANVVDLRVSSVDKHILDGEVPIRLCNYVDVYANDRIRRGMSFSAGTAKAGEVSRFRLRRGDVLITKDSESWDDIASPALVEHESDDLICGYHLAILRPRREISGAFLHRAIQSAPVARQYHVSANGVTRYGLTHGAIRRIVLPVPPAPDQAAIARYLDHVDSRIQRLIAAKQRLIELLEEEKQAIIHRAITRGLGSKVTLKPSGIEWVGGVPVHWEVVSLGAVVRSIQTGPFGSQLHASDYVVGGTPVINPSHLRGTGIRPDRKVAVSDEKARTLLRHLLRPGDVVTARRGELGRAALVTQNEAGWLCGTGSVRIRPNTVRMSAAYLLLAFESRGVRDSLVSASIGATMDNLSEGTLARLRFALPPRDEQEQIVRHVDRMSGAATRVVDRAHRHITLLREYRTRLISDVVTGKLDVREAATNLPADPDVDDPALDERLEEVVAA